MSTVYTYTVTGKGPFPLDMLRYDACWPARQDDISRMGSAYVERTVGITSNQAATVARWLSFGWVVKDHKARKQ